MSIPAPFRLTSKNHHYFPEKLIKRIVNLIVKLCRQLETLGESSLLWHLTLPFRLRRVTVARTCEYSWLSKGRRPPSSPTSNPSLTAMLLSAGTTLHWAESFSFSLHTNRESASWQHAVRHPDWRSHVAKTVTRVSVCVWVCVCVWSSIEKQPKVEKKRKENKAKQRQSRETSWALTWASASATTTTTTTRSATPIVINKAESQTKWARHVAHCASINARNWKGNNNNVKTVAQSQSALQQVPPAEAAAPVEYGFMSRQLRHLCHSLCPRVRLRFRLQFQLQFTHRLIVFLDGQFRLLQLAAVVSLSTRTRPTSCPSRHPLFDSCLQLI